MVKGATVGRWCCYVARAWALAPLTQPANSFANYYFGVAQYFFVQIVALFYGI